MIIPDQVLVLEGGLAVGFLTLLVFVRRKGGRGDDILWGLVWTTRLLASLNGSRRFPQFSAELGIYMGLQALAGLSLMLILARSELRFLKEKLFRRTVVQLTRDGGGARPVGLSEP
jgi:hypothetical protein